MLKTLVLGACLVGPLAACTIPSPTREVAQGIALAPAHPRGCVAATATRIPVKEQDCAGFGQTYTREDIERTGATDAAGVLRLLDPTLTVHGH
jgi:hypothetical protein